MTEIWHIRWPSPGNLHGAWRGSQLSLPLALGGKRARLASTIAQRYISPGLGGAVAQIPADVTGFSAMTTRQMIYMMLGAVVGMVIGIICLLIIFRQFGQAFQDIPLAVVILVLGLVVGGLVGGAYAVQAVITRMEKAKKKSKKRRKEKRRR